MISREQWDQLSPAQQRETCMNDLADLLQKADANLRLQPFNEETRIIEGSTTLICKRNDVIANP